MTDLMLYIRDRGQAASEGRVITPGSRYIIGRPGQIKVDITLHSPFISNHHADLWFSDRWHFLNRGRNYTWLKRGRKAETLERGQSIEILEGDEIWFYEVSHSIRFSYDVDGTLQGDHALETQPLEETQVQAKPQAQAEATANDDGKRPVTTISMIDGIDTLFEFGAYALWMVSELPLLRLIAIAVIGVAIAVVLSGRLNLFPFPTEPDKPPVEKDAAMLIPQHQDQSSIVDFDQFDRPFENPATKGASRRNAGE